MAQETITGKPVSILSDSSAGTAFASSTAFPCDRATMLTVYVQSGTVNVKWQFSPDNSAWYDQALENGTPAVGGDSVLPTHDLLGAAQNYRFRIPVCDNFFRMQYKRQASLSADGTLAVWVSDGLS